MPRTGLIASILVVLLWAPALAQKPQLGHYRFPRDRRLYLGSEGRPASYRGGCVDSRAAGARRPRFLYAAPIVALLGAAGWTDDECQALVDLIRAKGGRSEREHVASYPAHHSLDTAILRRARAHDA